MDPTQNEPKKDDTNDVDSLEGSSVVVEGSAPKPNDTSTTEESSASTPPIIAGINDKPIKDKKHDSQKNQFKLPGFSGFATRFNVYLPLFIFVLAIAAVVVFVALTKQKKTNAPTTDNTTSLNAQALGQIAGTTTTTVGNSKQILNIQSNTVFSGQVSMKSSLAVAGSLQVGNALSLPGLTVSGTSSFNTLQATSATVSGNETVQGQLVVQKGINVSGPVTFGGALSAASLSVNSLNLTGDLALEHHITTNGSLPSASSSGGGSASVSSTDTAGTININNGTCANLNYAQKFGNTPHVVATAVSGTATYAYLTGSTSSGFTVCGSQSGTFLINYIVVD